MKPGNLIVAAALAAISSFSFAGDADLTKDASLAYKHTVSTNCDTTDCLFRNRLQMALSHVFQLTPPQASSISSTTLVNCQIYYLGTVSFLIGDDPNFQDGDTSAQISKTATLIGVPVPLAAKASWGDGNFALQIGVKADVTTTGGIFAEAVPPSDSETSAAEDKGLFGAYTTAITTSLAPTASAVQLNVIGYFAADQVYMAADRKTSRRSFNSAYGKATSLSTDQVKTRFITTTPPVSATQR